jgi:FdhD protein
VNAPNDRLPITAAILAGGRSMRMGIDKTLLPVDGTSLVTRVARAVGEVCAHTLVVTNRPEAMAEAGLPPGVGIVADEVAYQGPLGALATALKESSDDWVLAVAADMPWLQPDVVRALWDARGGAQVVVPITAKGAEPLLALYHRSCLPAVSRVLESGRRRLVAIFPAVTVAEVPIESLRGVDPELLSLVNVNTAEDLAEARDARPSGRPAPLRADVAERTGRGLPSETPVTVYMNDVEVATMQATPDDLEELGIGFLVSEGLLEDRDDVISVTADGKRGLVYVVTSRPVPDDMVYKTRYITSGCGKGVTFSSIGHARGLAPLTYDGRVSSSELYSAVGQLARGAVRYRDTGGMHACGLVRDGSLVLLREDVGRHNALDKLLGRAWLDRTPTDDAVIVTTGRISYEMAVKAAKARVPIVVTRTAVTDLAAEIAEELGLTLVGYARGGRMIVYTHPERVLFAEEEPS